MVPVLLVLPEPHIAPPLLLVHRALDDQVVEWDVHLFERLPFFGGHVHLSPFLVGVFAHEDGEMESGKGVIVRKCGFRLVWVVRVIGVRFKRGKFEVETKIDGVFGDRLPFDARMQVSGR